MKKSIWNPNFQEHGIPRFPCPRCATGHLLLKKGDLHSRRPNYMTFDRYQESPIDSEERFVALLQCDNRACGEVISVAGNVVTIPGEGGDGSLEWWEYYEPAAMIPPPPIIVIPVTLPETVKKEIRLSFQLFWTDYRVCASRLRTSLERLMDHFGVAKYRIQRNANTPSAPGKRKPLDLATRIDKLPGKIGTTDYSEILHALRVIGNLGSHGGKVSHSAILDAYQLYEMALQALFADKSESAKAIIKRLKAHR